MDYQLQLGQLITVWTIHISNGEHGQLACSVAPFFTSIFPEHDHSCHLRIHEATYDERACRTPLGYRDGHDLGGLMTLKNYIDGGYDVTDCRIIACVKSIGAKKRGNLTYFHRDTTKIN